MFKKMICFQNIPAESEMFHTGLDPFTGEEIYVARGQREKRMQRALLRYKDPENYKLVYDALDRAGRMDLVGTAWNCLIGRRKW